VALNDDAVLVIGTGNYFTADVDTVLPSNLLVPGGAWESVGHTSLDKILTAVSAGGDATVVGTLQNKSLRTKYSARTETLSIVLEQFDRPGLKLYYGSNAPDLADGTVGVPTEPVVTTKAFLAIFLDGESVFAVYAPKAEIYRNDDLALADTETLAGLPIGVTPMISGTNAYAYAVTPLGVVVTATGVTAGIPGYFTPAGAQSVANLAAMTGLVASPTTAWTAGQYVVLKDNTIAKWSSTAWVVA
jgi:hypothetical protein